MAIGGGGLLGAMPGRPGAQPGGPGAPPGLPGGGEVEKPGGGPRID